MDETSLPARGRTSDCVVAAVLAAGAALLSVASVFARPGAALTADFLFNDQGHNLLVARTLLNGGVLYRDVFFQYGPLPAYGYAAAAAVFGNTPLVYLEFLALVSAINVALFYFLVRRAAGVPIAALATIGFIVTSLDPGSLLGGYTNAAYIPLERTVFLLMMLAWESPERRSLRRSILLGGMLGAWQGVRFGGAIFAAAALTLIDLGALFRAGWPATAIRVWMRSAIALAVAAVAVELVWVVWAFLTLPPALAADMLWPSYLLPAYKTWVSPALRWPAWEGWRMTVAQYLLPATTGLLGFVALARWLRTRPVSQERAIESRDVGSVFIPQVFFVLACCYFFREVHHFRQFMWTLVPAAAWELERRRAAMRAAVAAVCAPGVAVFLKSALVPVALGPLMAITLPSGGTIYAPPPTAERIHFLERFISTEARGEPVLLTQCSSGWMFAYSVPRETRHTWVWAPMAVRPYEERDFIASLSRTTALIDCDDNNPNGPPILRYPAAVADAMRARMRPWTTGGGCQVYHLR